MEALVIILVLVAVFVLPNIKVIRQAKNYVIERIGSYYTTWSNNIPFIDRIANKVTLKEIIKDFAPQQLLLKIMLRCK